MRRAYGHHAASPPSATCPPLRPAGEPSFKQHLAAAPRGSHALVHVAAICIFSAHHQGLQQQQQQPGSGSAQGSDGAQQVCACVALPCRAAALPRCLCLALPTCSAPSRPPAHPAALRAQHLLRQAALTTVLELCSTLCNALTAPAAPAAPGPSPAPAPLPVAAELPEPAHQAVLAALNVLVPWLASHPHVLVLTQQPVDGAGGAGGGGDGDGALLRELTVAKMGQWRALTRCGGHAQAGTCRAPPG